MEISHPIKFSFHYFYRDNLRFAFAKKRLASKRIFKNYAQLSRNQRRMETRFEVEKYK